MEDLKAFGGKAMVKGPAQAVQELTGPPLGEIWQIQIYLTLKAYPHRFAKKAEFKIPCICEYAFLTKEEARKFVPTFLDALVSNGILTQEEAWQDIINFVVNTNVVDVQLKPLKLLTLEN